MSRRDKEPLNHWVSDEDDQRDEFRLSGRVQVDIEVEADDPEEGAPPRWLRCATRDLSGNGISVVADEPLPEGALLPIRVLIDADQPFDLVVEVKWCRQDEQDGRYRLGLAVQDSGDSALLAWKEAIAELMASGA